MDKRGLIGPDEPRYASVAREMIESDDWVTPRLGAKAGFEKPVLLYWLGAVSAKLGVNDDRMTRLPVSLKFITTASSAKVLEIIYTYRG